MWWDKRGRNKYPNCNEVYLFGSFLYKEVSNDIDILVVYEDSECDINTQLDMLSTIVETVSNLPVDMTALSKGEMKEISFLNSLLKTQTGKSSVKKFSKVFPSELAALP